mgnify:FL=1|tara:strand:- start:86 stop:988 length:903 start_codon:yes stop_codon:yes gene_type:complete
MASASEMLQPEELQSIANLQLMARQAVEGAISGQHRSPHKGFSVEFAQHREYVQGDEVRRVDWKVFAKTDRYYVREYEEETNLRATLLVDASGSMGYAGEGAAYTKCQYALRLAACIAHIILQQRDSVGLITFDTEVRGFIPPRSSTRHLRILYDRMTNTVPGGETDLSKVFHEIVPRIQKRGMIFILSDCYTDVRGLLSSLAHFRHASHEVVLFHIMDRDEAEFPFQQWTKFENLERLSEFRMVDPASFRAAYLENLERFREELKRGCQRHRIDLVPIFTDEPLTGTLARFLKQRQATG